MRKFAAGDIVESLIDTIVNTDWMVSPQNKNDKLEREVSVFKEGVTVFWKQYEQVPVKRDGRIYAELQHVTKEKGGFSFTANGYSDFNGYSSSILLDDSSGDCVYITGDRMCELLAAVINNCLKEKLPQCRFNDVHGTRFTYSVPAPKYDTGF